MFLKKEKNAQKEEYVIIIGCGRLGSMLANSLSEQKRNVMIIDGNKSSFRKLDSSFGGLSLAGDAADIDILMEADIDKATDVIVVTESDNTNIMVSQIAKEIFGIESVIARLYDTERKCVYEELNINTICPADLSVFEIKRLLDEKE